MVLPATWLVWAAVGLVLVLFWGGYFIARATGQFDDLEQMKDKVREDIRSNGNQ
ncbi:MAG: cbb3-type cytochrome oxidase assembly protein CcoS [Proteobacteria bacterium]|nr:cbb3-type cytochrome oxidase assembly protein CcoS [Pseudomonadota bacterium]NIS68091.1 cbb3-type cytochrome oxidase assembly protein CcoS [Pseudomonadota bacterium]